MKKMDILCLLSMSVLLWKLHIQLIMLDTLDSGCTD